MTIEHAIQLARANTVVGLPKFGAVLSRKSRIIGMGLNSHKTHPMQAQYGKNDRAIHLHAEIAAMVNAKCDLVGSTLYVARVNKKGEPRLAMPCIGCQKAIAAFGIKQVHWTTHT